MKRKRRTWEFGPMVRGSEKARRDAEKRKAEAARAKWEGKRT